MATSERPSEAMGEASSRPAPALSAEPAAHEIEIEDLSTLEKTQENHESFAMSIPHILEPAHEALAAQLGQIKARLQTDAREAAAALRAAKSTRLELGNQLFRFQSVHDGLAAKTVEADAAVEQVQRRGVEVNAELARSRREAQVALEGVFSERQRVASLEVQLRTAMETLEGAEGMQATERAELAATKRATYAAHERAQKGARVNHEKEAYIEFLRGQLQRLQAAAAADRSAAGEASMDSEERLEEIHIVEAAIEDAQMEAAALERGWGDALRGLRRRDAEVQAAAQAVAAVREKERAAVQATVGFRAAAAAKAQANFLPATAVAQQKQQAEAAHARAAAAQERVITAEQAQKDVGEAEAGVAQQLSACQATTKEIERDVAELARKRRIVEHSGNELREKLMDMLFERAGATASDDILQRELRTTVAGSERLTEQTKDKEARILGLQAEVAKEGEKAAELEAELKAAAAREDELHAWLDGLRGAIEATLRAVEQRVSEKEKFFRALQRRLEAGKDTADAGPLQLQVASLERELEASAAAKQSLEQRWAQLDGQLLEKYQRTSQLHRSAEEAADLLEELHAVQTVLEAKARRIERDTAQLHKRLISLVDTKGRMDVAAAEAATLAAAAVADKEQTLHSNHSRLEALLAECDARRGKLETMAAEREEINVVTELLGERLQELQVRGQKMRAVARAQDPDAQREAESLRKLQEQSARLQRQLAAASKRRNAAAGELQRAAAAFGAAVERSVRERVGGGLRT